MSAADGDGRLDAPPPPFRGWQGSVCLLGAALAAYAFYLAGEPALNGDELDVVRPALEHMSGHYSTRVKYPSFPFYFYGVFLSLGGALHDAAAQLVVARSVHAALCAANLVLVYVLGTDLFASRNFGLLASSTYLAIPLVLLSAAQVKTESLQLAELLVTLIALRRMLREPDAPRFHLLAGVAAACSITTKLNALPVLLYALNALYLRRARGHFATRGALRFGAALVGFTLLSWTNLWVFDEVIRGWQRDQYFQPNASLFRAVDELWAFPNGRYSAFVFNTLPLAVGWPLLIASAAWCWRAPRGDWLNRVLGGGTALYLIVALNGTLLRIAHAFTPFYPYFALASVSLIHALATDGRARYGKGVAAAIATGVVAYTGWLASGMPAMRQVERERERLLADHVGDSAFLTLMESERATRDEEPIRERVERLRPQFLFVTSSHFLNMCKYRSSALYADNCRYYRELIAERAGYRLVKTLPAKIPGAALQLDPEVRLMAYQLLERRAR